MTATTATARTADGSYTREFLLWEADLAVRVAGRDVVDTARRLRLVLGIPLTAAKGYLIGMSDLRRDEPLVAEARAAYDSACEAFFGHMVDLADLDPGVDITPLLRGRA